MNAARSYPSCLLSAKWLRRCIFEPHRATTEDEVMNRRAADISLRDVQLDCEGVRRMSLTPGRVAVWRASFRLPQGAAVGYSRCRCLLLEASVRGSIPASASTFLRTVESSGRIAAVRGEKRSKSYRFKMTAPVVTAFAGAIASRGELPARATPN